MLDDVVMEKDNYPDEEPNKIQKNDKDALGFAIKIFDEDNIMHVIEKKYKK